MDSSDQAREAILQSERDKTDISNEIQQKETVAIRERRGVMFTNRPSTDDPIKDPVGLAFSGGGIRSASFNLGLLQALLERGLIRWVDFLSTVSGGGFMGAYLSTLLCHPNTKKLDKSLPIIPQKGDKTPEPVERFLCGGKYLKDPGTMLDRFLVGFLLNVGMWGALAVMATSFIAILWRMLDWPWLYAVIRDAAPPLGRLSQDWNRPFFFCILFFGLWLISWPISLVCPCARGECVRRVGRRLLWFAGLSMLIGVAVLLATDDIQFGSGTDGIHQRIRGHKVVGGLVLTLVLLNILPYLNPVRIFRSELRAPGKLESTILRVSGGALLLLLPFYLTFLFAREGIAKYHLKREPAFVAVDIPRPFAFLSSLRDESVAYQNHRKKADTPPADGGRAVDASRTLSAEGDDVLMQFSDLVYARCGPALMSHKWNDQSKAVLNGYPGIRRMLETGHEMTLSKALDDLPKDGVLTVLLKEKRELTKILTKYQKDLVPAADLKDRIDKLVYVKPPDWEQVTDPELDATIQFGLAATDPDLKVGKDGKRLPFLTLYRLRKIAGAYLAVVMNEHCLTDPELIEVWRRLHYAAQTKPTANNTLQGRADFVSERAANLREADEFTRLSQRALRSGGKLPKIERAQFNRFILEAVYFEEYLEERTKVGGSLCWLDDQIRRCWWLLGSAALFFLLASFVDQNSTSLHAFYQQKIEDAYVVQGTTGRRLQDLHTTKVGGPYHFICGTLNFFDDWPWKTTEFTSAYTFYFSRHFCGSQALPRPARTSEYCSGELGVATAVALSGAAFSPAIIRNPLLFCMTMLLNLRLGQWLPNPAKCRQGEKCTRRVVALPAMWDFLQTILGRKNPKDWDYCFISDGGHNDNLALAPLIFRNCRLMIVSDATQDPQYAFVDFLKAFRRYRIRGGMNFRRLESWKDFTTDSELLELAPLRPRKVDVWARDETTRDERRVTQSHEELHAQSKKQERVDQRTEWQTPDRSERHFLLSKLTREDGKPPTIVVYVKSTMTGDEPADLRQYQVDNPQFPHDPTTDQFFTENQVESYRQLGHHVGLEFCNAIQRGHELLGLARNQPQDLWTDDYEVEDLVYMLLLGYLAERDLPEDAGTLLELLQRCRNPRFGLELALQLLKASPSDAELQRFEGLCCQRENAPLVLDDLLDRLRLRGLQAHRMLETLIVGEREHVEERAGEEQWIRNIEAFLQMVEGNGDLPLKIRRKAAGILEEWSPPSSEPFPESQPASVATWNDEDQDEVDAPGNPR